MAFEAQGIALSPSTHTNSGCISSQVVRLPLVIEYKLRSQKLAYGCWRIAAVLLELTSAVWAPSIWLTAEPRSWRTASEVRLSP
jgi:hypothetical protein